MAVAIAKIAGVVVELVNLAIMVVVMMIVMTTMLIIIYSGNGTELESSFDRV